MTTSVDWEKTGTRTSVSAGKRKLKMQSVGRSTTTTLNVNTNVKLWCSFATKFFAMASFKTMQYLIFKTLLRVKHLWNNVFRQKKRRFCLLRIEWGVSFSSRATKQRISHAVNACQIVTTPHSTTHWLTASRSVTYFVWSRFPVVVQKSYFRPVETSSCLFGCALISVFQDSGYWLPIMTDQWRQKKRVGRILPLFVDLIRDICTV